MLRKIKKTKKKSTLKKLLENVCKIFPRKLPLAISSCPLKQSPPRLKQSPPQMYAMLSEVEILQTNSLQPASQGNSPQLTGKLPIWVDTQNSSQNQLNNSKSIDPIKQTQTGFYYPTGTKNYGTSGGEWLGRDVKNGGKYTDGYYHLGKDIISPYDSPVYAIADGEIIKTSYGGWGDNNVGVFVKHTLNDGTQFMALYGHIKGNSIKGTIIKAGEPFAKIGYWVINGKRASSDHLHFGIVPNTSFPKADNVKGIGYGRAKNTNWEDKNNFTDPISWIENKVPK